MTNKMITTEIIIRRINISVVSKVATDIRECDLIITVVMAR